VSTRHSPTSSRGDRKDHDLSSRGSHAFRPQTLIELARAFDAARDDPTFGVIILTGEGPDAFCSGGDQRIRGDDGYIGDDDVCKRGIGRLNVLYLQIQIRRLPSPFRDGRGYAIGGGQVLQPRLRPLDRRGERAGSPDPVRVSAVSTPASAQDCSLHDRVVRRAKEIWFLCRQYDAQRAYEMGLVNLVVPLADLEARPCRGAGRCSPSRRSRCGCSKRLQRRRRWSRGHPTVGRRCDDALLYEREAKRVGNAYVEKRQPDFSQFPRRP